MRNVILFNRDIENNNKLDIVFGELPKKEHLKYFYKVLQCETIDIVRAKIKNKYFDFIIDDEGKLIEKEPTALLYHDNKIVDFIAGSFLITQCNEKTGDTIPLTEEEINYIENNMIILKDNQNKSFVRLDY